MTEDPTMIRVRPGELRAQCPRCKRWGRKSEEPGRSEFHLHGRSSSGAQAWRRLCQDCSNADYRARLRKKRPPARLACKTVDVTDDYGVVQRVRQCTDCRSWLAATPDLWDRRGKQGGLQVACKDCRRARHRQAYAANPKPKIQRNRRYYKETRAELLSIDRALRAEQEGREYRPIKKIKHRDVWLPVEPFRIWLVDAISKLDVDHATGPQGGITRIAEMVGCNERNIRRIRDDYRTIRGSEAEKILNAVGGSSMEEIWPDYEEAVEQGMRRRFENVVVPSRRAA